MYNDPLFLILYTALAGPIIYISSPWLVTTMLPLTSSITTDHKIVTVSASLAVVIVFVVVVVILIVIMVIYL